MQAALKTEGIQNELYALYISMKLRILFASLSEPLVFHLYIKSFFKLLNELKLHLFSGSYLPSWPQTGYQPASHIAFVHRIRMIEAESNL